MSDTFQIRCKPAGNGQSKVTATLGKKRHPDTFDINDAFRRAKFRDAVIAKFDFDDDAHAFIEEKLLAAAESAECESSPILRPVLTMLDTVEEREVEWLWKGRLAIGKNNIVAGNPGLGKSLLMLHIAAIVSRGGKFPDGSRSEFGPAGVVILTMEDDEADTLKPRLRAHNADLSKIGVIKGATEIDGDGQLIKGIDLANDIEIVRAAIQQVPNCRLVLVDTINDYIGSQTDVHKNRDVRSVMNPFAAMANECRVANVCVSHLRKSEGLAIHSTMGSIGFVGQARVAWAVTRCPVNKRRRLLTCIKNNLADDTSGLAYTIESNPAGQPVLAWEAEPVQMNADQAMEQSRPTPGRKPDDRNSAAEWLRECLANGPRPAADILEQADAEGLKSWTVRRAFKQIGCKRHKGGFDGGWIWALPEDDSEDNTEARHPEFCHLRNLRKNPEDYSPNALTINTVSPKVTNCERPAPSDGFSEFNDELASLNGHCDDVPF